MAAADGGRAADLAVGGGAAAPVVGATGTVQVSYTKPLAGSVLRDPDLLPAANFTTPAAPIT